MNNTYPNAWQEINIDLLDNEDRHEIMKRYHQRTVMLQDVNTTPIYLSGEVETHQDDFNSYSLKIGDQKRQFNYQNLEKLIVPK